MRRLYGLLVHWTVHRQKLLLGLIILITVVLGFFAARIELKTNFKDLLSSSEPVMRAYDREGEDVRFLPKRRGSWLEYGEARSTHLA
ncbi:MAG: hypothetical protein U9Q94_08200 [Candidatus Bipolaricaulota bacterium]|nr:hypothetical protein [Candidatus Bipolaricaulota bacterium]